jgi:hypothetical protein
MITAFVRCVHHMWCFINFRFATWNSFASDNNQGYDKYVFNSLWSWNLAHVTFNLTSKSIQSPWTGEPTAVIPYCEIACLCTRSVISLPAHSVQLFCFLFLLAILYGNVKLHLCARESVGSTTFRDTTLRISRHICSGVVHISVVPKVRKFFETEQSVRRCQYYFSF